jgi:cobalt-zinc-cadmium efflux system outer membrane protein
MYDYPNDNLASRPAALGNQIGSPAANAAQAVTPASATVRLVRQEAIPPGTATRNLNLPPIQAAPSRRPMNGRFPIGFRLGPEGVVSLDEASSLALEFNPILRSAAAQIESARGVALQAGLWSNPRFDTNNPQVIGNGQFNQYNAGFQLEIPMKGKKRLDRSAAEQQVRQAIFDYRTDRMNMLTAVRGQFYDLLAQQRRVEISRELVAIAKKAQSIAEAMKGIGEQADVDVLPLSIEYQRAEATLLNAERILEGRRRQLAATIGLPNLPIRRAAGRLDGQFPVVDDARLRQFVATQHPRMLTAAAEIDRRRILERRAEVEPFPNPYTGPAAAWGPTTMPPTQFWYNIQFNIPIWDLNQGNRRAAAANIRDARASLGVLRNDLLRQAAEAYARFRAARALADRYGREILPLALKNQELNREAYEKREFEPLRYLLAQRLLTESYLEYIDALEEVWNAAAELGNLLQLEQFP